MPLRQLPLAFLALSTGLLIGCQSAEKIAAAERTGVPFHDGIGRHTRPVTTDSAMAQAYFNQGLVWTYAFNHGEAIRAYRAAAALDPTCAMAWWGVALCNGPHINNTAVSAQQARDAHEAIQKAQANAARCTPSERALIDALAQRCVNPLPAERRPLDEAYARAMAAAWSANPQDADVGTLYAESLMNLQPWDLWTQDGQAKGSTNEIVHVLEAVLALNEQHPGANHLYIHAVEASPTPGRAIRSADRLRRAVPASGHLVHMPSHVDVRTGRWAEASEANERAINADERYRAKAAALGFYGIYMAHNRHFLTYCAMMEGRREKSLQAARELLASIPAEYARENAALVDGFMPILFEVQMRFGMWDDILKEPRPADFLPITTAFWHFTRGVALAAKGRVPEAEREAQLLSAAKAQISQTATFANNNAHELLRIAERMLAGEISFRRGALDQAVSQLQEAVKLEDGLRYNEPPDWIQPVRHTLGAVLTSAGRHADAEAVYREDLRRLPENGWSLFGLGQCLRSRGATQEAEEVEKRFRAAWSRADLKLNSTCLCVNGTS